jgi:hypothetical protein
MKQRWFEQDTWNEEIEDFFFLKISRSQKELASQYIRVQAIKFLSMPNEKLNNVAHRLIQILFDSYPERYMDIMFCHEALADFYYSKEEYENSFSHYETIRNYNSSSQNARYCTITSELGMLKCLLKIKHSSKKQLVKELINEMLPYLNNNFQFFDNIRKDFITVCRQINQLLKDDEIENIIKFIEGK